MGIAERRRIFNKMMAFIRSVGIQYKCFSIEKKHIKDSVEATGKLSKQISSFIRNHYDDFLAFNDVKIYYDNGQVEVSKLLSSVFNALLPNPIFRKVMPTDYKLFQVADFICTMELLNLKLENNLFSRSEMIFFGNKRDLKQNYLKALRKNGINSPGVAGAAPEHPQWGYAEAPSGLKPGGNLPPSCILKNLTLQSLILHIVG